MSARRPKLLLRRRFQVNETKGVLQTKDLLLKTVVTDQVMSARRTKLLLRGWRRRIQTIEFGVAVEQA